MEFYGNTLPEWLLACIIIILSMVLAKVFYWLCSTTFRKLTKKTKTNLDDILLDKLEEPIVFGVILGGFYFSIQYLNILESYESILSQAFYILFAINITWLTSRIFVSLISEYIEPLVSRTESDLDDQLLPILKKGINITIWILGLLVALNNIGVNVSALLAGLGVGGIAFAMASKDTIANMFAGFTIFADHPFKINDRIKTKEFDGYVREIGIRTTRVQTLQGRMVIVPNEKITNQTIENISLEKYRRVDVTIYVSNNNSSKKLDSAIDKINEVILTFQNIEFHKAILQVFNEYSFGIRVLYNIKTGEDYFEVQDQLNQKILKELNELEIEFPKRKS